MAPMPINDSVFLLAEKREQPMHVGGLEIFDLPSDAGEDWVRNFYEETITAPTVSTLFRRKPHRSPASLGAWSWQLDNDIDLEYHIRHSALPRPGRVRELLALVSRLHGTLLDRHRPLWEAHVIEGLEGDRFALYIKIHHALVDGVSAMQLLAHALSDNPDDKDVEAPWTVEPPKRQQAVSRGLASLLDVPRAALRTTSELTGLGPVAARALVKVLLDQSSYLPSRAPRTILNVPITGARRYAAQSWPLERIKSIGKASATTVNDVVLTICAGALRSYLQSLDALPDQPLVAMTPVSLRQAGADAGGNAVGAVLCNLATNLPDAGERLSAVHESMVEAKKSLKGMSPAQAAVISAANLLPMVFSAVGGIRRIAPVPFNLVISNVPGPQHALYLRGARLDGSYPLSIPTDGLALNLTCMSYNGSMEFGLTGCRRTVPHLQRLLTYLDESLGELEAVTS